MKNFNENLFKGCIKRKISFTASTFVKFLITGTIALSLTACGGGGGGGGSSSTLNDKTPIIQEEDSNGNLITTNENYINKGNITLNNNSIGIIGSNSDITNDGDISIDTSNTLSNNSYPEIEFETSLAKNYYKILQEMGVKAGIISEKGNVVNSGNINLTGNESWGIVGIYSNILNKGNITSTNSTDSVGIMNLGGDTINDGNIILDSDDGIGIYVANKIGFKTGNDNEWIIVNGDGVAQVTNNGTIEVNGKKSQIGINAEGKNIDITNSEKGEININNNYLYSSNENEYEHYLSAGISSDYLADEAMNDGDIKIINKGKINITSNIDGEKEKFTAGSIGIHTEGDKTTIVNSGDIFNNIVLGENSKIKGAYSFGILTEGNETTINNNGNIDIKVTDNSKDKTNNKVLVAGIVNLSNSANDIVNNNTINIIGKKYNGALENLDSNIFGGGIYSNIGNVTNNGVISIVGDKMFGIYGGNNSIIKNENEIKLDGDYVVGIKGDNSQLINNKNISINSKNSLFISDGTLLPSITYETGKTIPELILGCTASIGIDGENSKITNNGNISIKGNKIVGIYGYDSEITTEEGSKITLTGGEATGIYGANNSTIINKGDIITNITNSSSLATTDGILVEGNGKAENYGNIIMNGKVHVDKDGVSPDIFVGMNASGEKSEITNSGTIKLKHEIDLINPYDNTKVEPDYDFDAVGMQVTNGALAVNNKDIIGQGAIVGIHADTGAIAKNNGNIKLTSIHYDAKYEIDDNVFTEKFPTYVYGMNGKGEGTKIENTGIIDITGDGLGIKVADGAEGTNGGTINLTSQPIKIEENNTVKYTYLRGMDARRGSTVTNLKDGIINLNGHGVGIRVRKDSKGYNYGTINISSKGYANGMNVQDNGYVENHGDIVLETGNSAGIELYDNSFAENKGNIILKAEDSIGIKIFNNGTTKNYGKIVSKNSDTIGIGIYDNGSAENYGEISMSGKLHVDKNSITPDNFIGMNAEEEKATITNNGIIKLEHTINLINPYDNIEEPDYDFDAVGMEAGNGALAINNKNIIGQGAITGMNAYNDANITNSGTIKLSSLIFEGKYTDGDITRKEIPSWITGMNGSGNGTIVKNESSGIIDLTGEGTAIRVTDGAEGINNGTINLTSQIVKLEGEQPTEYTYLKGMDARRGATVTNLKNGIINLDGNGVGMRIRIDSKGYNHGTINISSKEYARGMDVQDNGYAENHGDIISKTENVDGIRIRDNGYVENYGNIYVKDHGTGILAFDSSTSINYGTITAIGEGAVGMEAFNNAIATNEKDGIINAGTGALGMYATDNGVIINKGTINVTEDARGGMLALDGGRIENYGKVIVDKDASDNVYSIFADNDANIKNEGEIVTNGDVNIEVGGTYTIGTTTDKTFGKLTGNNISLNGNLVVTTDIAKGSYDSSYKLDNMIEGENITLGDSYKNFSDSLLYDLEVSKDKDGNLDGELTRNENSIADFTNNNFSQIGKLFDKYLAKENYEKLSKKDKELVDKIFTSTSSSNKVEEAIEKVAGREYLNISRQIFDIKDSFRKYDSSVISTLGKYDCNFTLIGEYGDINSKAGVVGYDSKMTGFNGAFKLSDSLFGTIGYGYSDIDYDKGAEGKIQTIHGGIYKDYAYNKSNIRLGIFGEYNFHETDRENLFGNVNADFNSYLVGVTGEISKKYGDSLYIQPKLSLDIAYGNVESFDEDNSLEMKEQDYTSVLPKVEIILGKNLNNVELFVKSSYSCELGDLDKDMEISLLNENIKVKNDTMDKGNLNLSVGTEVNFDNLSLTAELGKEFGKRDREFVKAGFSYKF